MSGNLFLIVAPSGAGKSTLLKSLLKLDSDLCLSISYTTRAPRLGEILGKDYFFVELCEFERLRKEKKMLEWAKVHSNFYGTPRDWVLDKLEQGKDVILEIDWQGATQIKNVFDKTIEIFILPPSLAVLEQRLKKRGQDTEESMIRRLKEANRELLHASEADYIVINLDFQVALRDLKCIVDSSRLRINSQSQKHKNLFKNLGISC